METEGIVELFQESWDKHGIVYKLQITVIKFTCVNHKLKNHDKAIEKIAAKPKQNKEVRKGRRLVGSSKLKFRQEILEAATRRREDKTLSYKEKLKLLRQNIIIVPYHVFGDHEKCQKNSGWPCTKIKIEGEENLVPFLTETGVLEELLDLQRNVAA